MNKEREDKIREEVLADILAERLRQIEVEGNTTEKDDAYKGELAAAAACYAIHSAHEISTGVGLSGTPAWWPWHKSWWKPYHPRRNLIRAAALILAMVEKIDRASAGSSEKPGEGG